MDRQDSLVSSDLINLLTNCKSLQPYIGADCCTKQMIDSSAIKHCHLLGLHSAILQLHPVKIRLFVAGSTCELLAPFSESDPVIPIHPHKHTDLFFSLSGQLINHIYCRDDVGLEFLKINHSRLDSNVSTPVVVGSETLKYYGSFFDGGMTSKSLHTVSCYGPTTWVVVELNTDPTFESIGYTRKLQKCEHLYQPFVNPVADLENLIKETL